MGTDVWNPDTYEVFKAERDRPAEDLIALLAPTPDGTAVDLGCGAGHLTAQLAEHLQADVLGIDSSPAMLERAEAHRSPMVRFTLGDLASWGDPDHPVDVVFANASLQWVPDHAGVLARWTAALRPAGQLAVQVPANADHPAYLLAAAVAASDEFADAFAPVGGPPADHVAADVLSAEAYASLLFDLGYRQQQVRLQVYGPVLPSPLAVVDWMRGTTLTRFEEVLDAETYARFLARFTERVSAELGDRSPYYFTFKRILLWGRRPG